MRVYVPLTSARLVAAYQAETIGPAPLRAFAVTPALREWYATGDDEELEYVALTKAARASLGLLAEQGGRSEAEDPRRVVAVCETDATHGGASGTLGEAGLTLDRELPWSSVAAVHIDAAGAADVVRSAVNAWVAAHNGDDDALFTMAACEGEELLWYATQEVPDLLAELGLHVGRGGAAHNGLTRDGPTQGS